MKTLILFGGGDGGGLMITPNGVSPIPPFDPALLNSIRSTANIMVAMGKTSDSSMQGKLSKMDVGMANISVELAENIYGPLNPDRAIVYQDEDGGFTCGTAGKPPWPFPWPPKSVGGIDDVIKSKAVGSDVVNLVQMAKAKGLVLTDVFEKPAQYAKDLGVTLSTKGAKELSILAPSNLSKVKDPVDREVITLFHAVLMDGRFTETWYHKPFDVSRQLKVKLSDAAISSIINVGGRFGGSVMDGGSAIAAGVIWAGVCIAVGTLFVGQMNPINNLINDRSGNVKF